MIRVKGIIKNIGLNKITVSLEPDDIRLLRIGVCNIEQSEEKEDYSPTPPKEEKEEDQPREEEEILA